MQASLRSNDPELYRNVSYTSVEISKSLADLQRARVSHDHGHGTKFLVEHRDATDLSSWTVSSEPTFFVLAEVLDNLPHDRYELCRFYIAGNYAMGCLTVQTQAVGCYHGRVWRQSSQSPWQETVIRRTSDGQLREVVRPLGDELVMACLAVVDGDCAPVRPLLTQWLDRLVSAGGAHRAPNGGSMCSCHLKR